MDTAGEFYIYSMGAEGGNRCYASPLPEHVSREKGLPSEALAGEFTQGKDQITPEHFECNPAFVNFLMWALAKHVRNCPAFVEAAAKAGTGRLMLADMRGFRPNEQWQQEDTLGFVEVEDGKAASFHALRNYTPFTSKGFMQINPWLFEKYLEELIALVEQRANK